MLAPFVVGVPQPLRRDALTYNEELATSLVTPDGFFNSGAPCGDACRDPNAPGPVYHLAENKVLPELKSPESKPKGPGEMKDCPPLNEIVPCAGKGHNPYESPCSACIPKPLRKWPNGTKFTAKKLPGVRTKPLYLIIAVPAFQGSSGLEGLFSSSPSVSTMCAKSVWQCEATATLMREGVFTRANRYHPDATNWTRVYEVYNSPDLGSIWNDPTRPILMDKSPPNLAKSKSMIEFFEKNDMDYRFVAMARHPCMYNRMTDVSFSLLMSYMRDVLANVPAKKIFKISYNDFVSRPDRVAKKLLDWLPELMSLDINASYLEWSGAQGNGQGRVIPGTDYAYRGGQWTRTGVVAPPMDGVPAATDLEYRDGIWTLKPPHLRARFARTRTRTRSSSELLVDARTPSASELLADARTRSTSELFVDGVGMAIQAVGAAHSYFTKGAEPTAESTHQGPRTRAEEEPRALALEVSLNATIQAAKQAVTHNDTFERLWREASMPASRHADVPSDAIASSDGSVSSDMDISTPETRGDHNSGDISSLVNPADATFSGAEHGGRELPILQYAQRDCRLKVIKRQYNTNDLLPFVTEYV